MTHRPSDGRPRGGVKARQLAEALRSHVVRSCQPGDRLPAEAELARRYRRSVTTVRSALALLAAEGLIVRVHGSGTYVGDRLPRETGTTGLFFYGGGGALLSLPYARLSYLGILDEVAGTDRHVHLMLGDRKKPFAMTAELAERVDLGRIDSLICLEVFDQSLLQRLGEQLVTVSVDMACFQSGVSSCVLDHQQNLDLAVEHLWRLGHERIALVGDVNPRDQDPACGARREAFLQALRARDLPVGENTVTVVPTPAGMAEWVSGWRAQPSARRPTAVVNVPNFWPFAQILLHEGIQVPEELSVISIGDPGPWLEWVALTKTRNPYWDLDQHLADYRTSPLDTALAPLRLMAPTAVLLPFAEMGRWAMRETLRRIRRPNLEPEHEPFAGTIKPGNTVAPPRF